MAIRGIGELEIEVLCIFLGLLETVGGVSVFLFGFNDSQEKVSCVAEEVIDALGLFAEGRLTAWNDAAFCVGALLGKLIIRPAGSVKLRQDERSACIRFRGHELTRQ